MGDSVEMAVPRGTTGLDLRPLRIAVLAAGMRTGGGVTVGLNLIRSFGRVEPQNDYFCVVPLDLGYEQVVEHLPHGRLFAYRHRGMLRRHADFTHFLSPRSLREFVGGERLLRTGRGGVMLQGVEEWPEHPLEPGPHELDPQLRAVLDKPTNFCFLYLATVHAGKGHHWLIEGLAPVLCRHPEVYAIMPGRQDPHVADQLRRLTERLGVARQVILPGLIDRRYVPWLIARCHAGLVASRSETFGHTILEPMVGGKPVIGTRRGIGEYLIMDYFTGIGFEYGDRAALERAAEYLATHRDEATRMGQSAARLTRSLYTWDITAATHLRMYQSLWTEASESSAWAICDGSPADREGA